MCAWAGRWRRQGDYLTEPFSMMSHVWLRIEPGATLSFGEPSAVTPPHRKARTRSERESVDLMGSHGRWWKGPCLQTT
jgi:hypothetical protein